MSNRIREFQTVMKRDGIDSMVLCMPENVVLLSGYWPRNGFSFVFIPREGDACLICPEADFPDTKTSRIPRIETFGWVRLTDGDPQKNIENVLRKLAKEFGVPEGAVVSVEIGQQAAAPPLISAEMMLPGSNTLGSIRRAFATEKLVTACGIVDEIRQIKSSEDIEKLEKVNKLAHAAIKHFDELINRDNMREIDVAAQVEEFVSRTGYGFEGVQYARAWAQVTSGERTADAWFAGMISGGRVLQKKDLVMLEMAVVADGYWSDVTQTSCVGFMDGQKAEMCSAIVQAQSDAVTSVRDGVPAAEIDAVARRTLERAGFEKEFIHHTGHGVGLGYHENTPRLAPGSQDTLRAGMTHSVEPGIYIPGVGGVRLEVNVCVCEDGYRILGKF